MGLIPSHNLPNNLMPRSNYSNRHNNSNSPLDLLDPEVLMALSNQLLPSIMNLPQNSSMNHNNDNYKQSRNNRQHKQNRPYKKNSPPRNNHRNDGGGSSSRRDRYDSGNGNRNR